MNGDATLGAVATVITQNEGSIHRPIIFWMVLMFSWAVGVYLDFSLNQRTVVFKSLASIIHLSFLFFLFCLTWLLYRALLHRRSITISHDGIIIDGVLWKSTIPLEDISAIEIFFDRNDFSLVAEAFDGSRTRLLFFSSLVAAEQTAAIIEDEVTSLKSRSGKKLYHPIRSPGVIPSYQNTRILSENSPLPISLTEALRIPEPMSVEHEEAVTMT